jgi:DNA-binding LytR/AlgR family response regulator
MSTILIVEDQRLTQEGLIKIAKDLDKALDVIATGMQARRLIMQRIIDLMHFFWI